MQHKLTAALRDELKALTFDSGFVESRPVFAYNNLFGFSKQMLLDVEEFDDIEARHEKGERFNLSEDEKRRLVRTVRSLTNVYFILSPDHLKIKIGQARDVNKRLSSLRTSSPTELRLLASVRAFGDLEKFLHKKLHSSRVHGEWFNADEEVLSVIEGAIDGGVRGILSALKINIDAM